MHGDEARIAIHNEMTGVFEEAVFSVCQVPADLLSSTWHRTRRDPGNVHTSCPQVHHGENVVRPFRVQISTIVKSVVPAENRVGCHDGCEFQQSRTANGMSLDDQ